MRTNDRHTTACVMGHYGRPSLCEGECATADPQPPAYPASSVDAPSGPVPYTRRPDHYSHPELADAIIAARMLRDYAVGWLVERAVEEWVARQPMPRRPTETQLEAIRQQLGNDIVAAGLLPPGDRVVDEYRRIGRAVIARVR